jgi:hypothetical protein
MKLSLRSLANFASILLLLSFIQSCAIKKGMLIANKQLFTNLYATDQRAKEEAGKVADQFKIKDEDSNLDDEIERLFIEGAKTVQKNIAERDSIVKVNMTDEKALKQLLKDELSGKSNIIAGLRAKVIDDSLTMLLIQEGIKNSYTYKIPNEIMFSLGGYRISDKNIPKIQEFFTPVIDSIVTSANKYVNKRLKIKIVFLGYSDADPINPKSQLYTEIAQSIYHNTYDSTLLAKPELLNLELSRLRAEDVGGLVRDIVFDKINYITGVKSIAVNINKEGRGEELPDNKIKYNVVDARRRMVKFYWKILPD